MINERRERGAQCVCTSAMEGFSRPILKDKQTKFLQLVTTRHKRLEYIGERRRRGVKEREARVRTKERERFGEGGRRNSTQHQQTTQNETFLSEEVIRRHPKHIDMWGFLSLCL